jgi:ABC-2 type transport system ATP-binding protein
VTDSPQVLDVRGAERRYGDRQALAGVDLAAIAGQIVVLLGPNGAGKTTLVRSICGQTRLDNGSVRVCGADPATDRSVRRRIGLVPQDIALYETLAVRTNLEVFGRLSGLRGDALKTAVATALADFGLADRADDAVRDLSGGMQRRVNIAVGTLHSPALLLLDEPTVGIDPVARQSVHQVLRGLAQRGMALLLTTHDLAEAEQLADTVVVMAEGRVRACGRVAQLISELFAGRQEINLLLARPPDGATRTLLTDCGLSPTAQPEFWVGAVSEDLQSLADLRHRLRGAAIQVAELRVVTPGLHGVFLRVTGRPPAIREAA